MFEDHLASRLARCQIDPVSRPVLSICVRCRTRGRGVGGTSARGDELADAVRALRKQRALKNLFKVDELDCLSLCDTPCAAQLEGRKRSTITRVGLRPSDAERLVEAACAYAALEPGQDLPERLLPGEHAD